MKSNRTKHRFSSEWWQKYAVFDGVEPDMAESSLDMNGKPD
jgi:hypothetical protein